MGRESGFGRLNSNGSLMKPDWNYESATFLRAQVSGIRLNRLFSFISQNWRGKPLVSHQVIVDLISATSTKAGLKVRAQIDSNLYPAGRKVSDKEVSALHIERDAFHGEWNYKILPRSLVN
jgi:hypothetical protein